MCLSQNLIHRVHDPTGNINVGLYDLGLAATGGHCRHIGSKFSVTRCDGHEFASQCGQQIRGARLTWEIVWGQSLQWNEELTVQFPVQIVHYFLMFFKSIMSLFFVSTKHSLLYSWWCVFPRCLWGFSRLLRGRGGGQRGRAKAKLKHLIEWKLDKNGDHFLLRQLSSLLR